MKKVDLLGAAHNDVADARQDEGVDAAGDAVFYDDISLMAMDTAEEDGLGVLKCFVQIAKAFFGGEGADDFEMDVHAVALDERFTSRPSPKIMTVFFGGNFRKYQWCAKVHQPMMRANWTRKARPRGMGLMR